MQVAETAESTRLGTRGGHVRYSQRLHRAATEDQDGKPKVNLKDLLLGKAIDPQKVLVLRHRPSEQGLKKMLPRLARERPEVFNAYQQTQPEHVEREMQRAEYIAAFIGHEPGKALFVGLYSVKGWKPITREEYWRIPANAELKAFGMEGFTAHSPRASILWFDLELTDLCAHLRGKLVVRWPPTERNWHRWAHKPKNEMTVLEPLDQSTLGNGTPSGLYPDEVASDHKCREGAVHQVTVNAYERDPEARKQCIAYYGATCHICGFNFGQKYGALAEGYIHVHHLKPLSQIGESHSVDHIADLRPVCPNCHGVIHLGGACRSVEQVKQLLQTAGRPNENASPE
jgi:hypothetical protein